MTVEQKLGAEVLFSIHLKDHDNIIFYYKRYTSHLDLIPRKKQDSKLLDKINFKYTDYMVEYHTQQRDSFFKSLKETMNYKTRKKKK